MTIKHAKVSGVADSVDTTLVRPTDQNADHVWLAETSDPPSPVEGQCWVLDSGGTYSVKIRKGGLNVVIASTTP